MYQRKMSVITFTAMVAIEYNKNCSNRYVRYLIKSHILFVLYFALNFNVLFLYCKFIAKLQWDYPVLVSQKSYTVFS